MLALVLVLVAVVVAVDRPGVVVDVIDAEGCPGLVSGGVCVDVHT